MRHPFIRPRSTGGRRPWPLAVLSLLVVLTGCRPEVPAGLQPVTGFDVERYMGTWYEVARLDHSFERGLERVTATYALQPDRTVRVVNRGFDTKRQEWREAEGRAKFIGAPDVAALAVSFSGPFYGGYNVIELDPAYQTALVAGPDRSYLWILSRTATPPRDVIDRYVARAAELGFDTGALTFVRH